MSLTMVTYHYLRDVAGTRYPGIKARSVSDFRGQLDYLARHYSFVRMEDVVAKFSDPKAHLPNNAVLLTFDDGYSDHFKTVLPILEARGIHGAFFPVAKAVLEGVILEVNKIQFILSLIADPDVLIDELYAALDEARSGFDLADNDAYWRDHGNPSRFDIAQVAFFKRMLQSVLPPDLARRITRAMFAKYVTTDEAAFAVDLYADADQLRAMVEAGMHVGSHAYSHARLGQLSPTEQREEVRRSMEFLSRLGAPTEDWVMCYPHGDCDDSIQMVLAENGCALGLTVKRGLVRFGAENPYLLPRLDTNDIPLTGDDPINSWTKDALSS